MLLIENIEVVYHHTVQVLRGLSLEAPEGKIIALLGSNGAGKSTTLKAASRLLELENGKVRAGRILFKGLPVSTFNPDKLVHHGLFHIREGRRIFTELTVEENLIAASNALLSRNRKADYDRVYKFFPRLKDRQKQVAGYLSGGEQQMLAFGRAMIAKPSMILMDEPSLGLAPNIISEIFEIIRRFNVEDGISILLVEQNANVAFSIADYCYIMESGQIVMEGSVGKLRADPDVRSFYLGMGAEGEACESLRNVKHYKRRKRWLS